MTTPRSVAVGANSADDEKPDASDRFPSEFLHVTIAHRRPDLPQVLWSTDNAVPSKCFKELEIVECAIAFCAYNYSVITATGNELTMKSSLQKVEPGTHDQYRTQQD